MKFIENQITSAVSDIRSRIKGKVSPERAALQTMSKIDSSHDKKIRLPGNEGEEYDENVELTETEVSSEGYTRENVADSSLSVHYEAPRPSISSAVSKSKALEPEKAQHSVIKKIISKSSWDNDFISAAVPALLIILPIISEDSETDVKSINLTFLKLQLIREIEAFKKDLLSKQYLPEDVDKMCYMLCTFIDEKLAENGIVFDVSLLIQFYKDSWGGEKCFDHLEEYLEKPVQNKQILSFYDLFLSLGFLGKYGIIEHGIIILNNLRGEIKNILFPSPISDLTYLLNYDILRRRYPLITPLKLFSGLLLLFLLLYLLISFYLHNLSRDLRNEILAWQPPILATIRETPPPELAAILNEGWLQIREHPLGWLLIFTSDGAFNVGSAVLTTEFKEKKNIERLGNALANYPGDLVVMGHTDNTPYRKGTGSNLQLSIDRAKTVENELRNGTKINTYNKRTISSEGKGEAEPLASNATAEGRAKNRRVDILWKIGRKEKDEVIQILNDGGEETVQGKIFH